MIARTIASLTVLSFFVAAVSSCEGDRPVVGLDAGGGNATDAAKDAANAAEAGSD